MQSTTPPNDTHPSVPVLFKNLTMYAGESAQNILGFQWYMLYMPIPLIERSQSVMIGANMKATR